MEAVTSSSDSLPFGSASDAAWGELIRDFTPLQEEKSAFISLRENETVINRALLPLRDNICRERRCLISKQQKTNKITEYSFIDHLYVFIPVIAAGSISEDAAFLRQQSLSRDLRI